MKKQIYFFIMLLAFTMAGAGFCKEKTINVEKENKVEKMIKAGAKVFDIRSTQEFSSGAYPGAKNIPVDEVSARLAEFGEKEKPIILYCASGARSGRAKMILENAGYSNVVNAGGLSDLYRLTGE